MGHLATAEAQRHLDLVALFEEAQHALHLHRVVVGVDVGPELDFLDFDDLLVLAGFRRLLLGLELVLAEVQDLADGRRRNLDEVETGLDGGGQRIGNRYDAEVVTSIADQLDLGDPDFAIDARTLLDGGGGSVRTTNGCQLL